jgi:hypothetical protein
MFWNILINGVSLVKHIRKETRKEVMKVIAFNGSARKQGNTAILINHVFSELEKEGIAAQ